MCSPLFRSGDFSMTFCPFHPCPISRKLLVTLLLSMLLAWTLISVLISSCSGDKGGGAGMIRTSPGCVHSLIGHLYHSQTCYSLLLHCMLLTMGLVLLYSCPMEVKAEGEKGAQIGNLTQSVPHLRILPFSNLQTSLSPTTLVPSRSNHLSSFQRFSSFL